MDLAGQQGCFQCISRGAVRAGLQRDRFHGRWQYLFIESICNDAEVLERNYRFKMMYSPDYTEQDSEAVRTNPGRSLFDPEPPRLFQVAMLLR